MRRSGRCCGQTLATYVDPELRPGCLVVLAATNCSPGNDAIREDLAEMRRDVQGAIRRRLARGVDEAELPAGTDTAAMALFYGTVWHGLSIKARDGFDAAQFGAVVDMALSAWDGFRASAGGAGSDGSAERRPTGPAISQPQLPDRLSVRLSARMMLSRSDSERPPQIPYGSCTARAWLRQSSSTGHIWQIAFALASRRARAGPRSPSGWKNEPLSIPRQDPSSCQSQTSALGPGSLRVSAIVTASGVRLSPAGLREL